jgi:hypothetical protein
LRYFTNPLTIEVFDEHFSGENWPLAFSTGRDCCDGKHYAVTTDHVNGSMTDPVCAAELAMLFSKSIIMYDLIKDLIEADSKNEEHRIKFKMENLIENLEKEINEHREEVTNA